ncbi:hypothetical protein HF995_05390 [Sanguibacter hominis ATCC BAA-789]|uniref:Uncharacterized protein n=1 Tax=Sanguibacter hominis ATCC BAA-789 TaxID=1312740 RepID=A0A9X5FCU0_9MICO|nr:hypothetical protein [Sanguibacter hominis]NKX92712.1 hypothetical protein [Sanguibacter hominis ATCC BAA-789]
MVAMMAAGAGSASAWTYATKSAPQSATYKGVSHGDGYGAMYRSGYNYVITTATLRDNKPDNDRAIFVSSQAWASSGTARTSTAKTHNRDWTTVAQTRLHSANGWVGASGWTKVCEDASLRPDICSTERYSPFGGL